MNLLGKELVESYPLLCIRSQQDMVGMKSNQLKG
jgi:hypothetical protein